MDDVVLMWEKFGMLSWYVLCYIVKINGYVIEGYVLVSDIKCLFKEKFVVIGLVVFGML